jgi:hypothetical protein
MITTFKLFEKKKVIEYKTLTDEDKEEIKKDITHQYRMYFDSEDDFNEFVLDENNEDDLDEVDWENVPHDVLNALDLDYPDISFDDMIELMGDVMSEINLDEYYEPRDGSLDDWKSKKDVNKFSI